MPMRPFTDAEREQIRALHAAGHGRNEISRQTGIHNRRVSDIAKELGLSFVRSKQTQAATEAKVADGKERRAALALALLDDAERLRKQLWQQALVYNFGGKDNTFEKAVIPEPSFRDKRDIMQAIGVAIDRSVRLDEYDSGAGVGEVVSLLDRMSKGLADKYGSGDQEHPVEDQDVTADG